MKSVKSPRADGIAAARKWSAWCQEQKLGSFVFSCQIVTEANRVRRNSAALKRESAVTLSAQLAKFAQRSKSNAQIWANAT